MHDYVLLFVCICNVLKCVMNRKNYYLKIDAARCATLRYVHLTEVAFMDDEKLKISW